MKDPFQSKVNLLSEEDFESRELTEEELEEVVGGRDAASFEEWRRGYLKKHYIDKIQKIINNYVQ